MATLSERLIDRLAAGPDQRALGHMDGSGKTYWLTRGELLGRACGASDFLRENGLVRGDTCILRLENEAAAVITLAAVMIGVVPLLLPPENLRPSTPDGERILAKIISRIEARAVIGGRPKGTAGPGLRSRRTLVHHISAKEALDRGRDASTTHPSGADTNASGAEIALLQATSGTTGVPKICAWKHRDILDTLDNTAVALGISRGDVFFNWTPLYHDLGLVNNFLLCLVHGIPLVNLNPTDFIKNPSLWIRGMSSEAATMTFAPNFGFAYAARKVRDEDLDRVDLRAVRAIWNAAERVHPETMREFLRRFSPYGLHSRALKTSYGLAENVGGVTFSDLSTSFPLERVDRAALQGRGEARVVSQQDSSVDTVEVAGVGVEAPGVIIEIRSRSGQALGDGRVGEIVVRADSIMDRYIKDARATRATLREGLIWTGDLGYVRDKQLFWVGRKNERITVRGRKLDPSDFEWCLMDIPGLRNGSFVAFGQDDPTSGTQRVVIIAEQAKGAGVARSELVETIRSRAFEHLGVGVEVVLVPKGTLLKTSSGKRRHRHFRHSFEHGDFDSFRE